MNRKRSTSLLDSGRIFIWGEINEESAEQFIKDLRYVMLRNIPSVYIYIHSEGGDVDSACAIIDEIEGVKTQKVRVHTIGIGKAYSCDSFILCFGSKGYRYVTKNTGVMLHPMHYELPSDYIDAHRSFTEFSTKQYLSIITSVAKACGNKTKKDINAFISSVKDGLWLNCEESIDIGIIDGEWDYSWEKEIDEEARNR